MTIFKSWRSGRVFRLSAVTRRCDARAFAEASLPHRAVFMFPLPELLVHAGSFPSSPLELKSPGSCKMCQRRATSTLPSLETELLAKLLVGNRIQDVFGLKRLNQKSIKWNGNYNSRVSRVNTTILLSALLNVIFASGIGSQPKILKLTPFEGQNSHNIVPCTFDLLNQGNIGVFHIDLGLIPTFKKQQIN